MLGQSLEVIGEVLLKWSGARNLISVKKEVR